MADDWNAQWDDKNDSMNNDTHPSVEPSVEQQTNLPVEENWSFWSSVSAIASQVKHVAEESIDIAYSQIDPEYKNMEKSEERKSPTKFETKDLMKTTENVLSIMDKGFDFASDLVGNTLYKGYETGKQLASSTKMTSSTTVTSTSTSDQLPETPVKNQKSNDDLKKTVTELSSKLMDVSINTLEGIGKNVYEIAPKQKRVQNKEFTTMESYFEEINGKKHINELATISSNKRSALNWDVDDILENALDEDEINTKLLDDINTVINGKPLPCYSSFNNDNAYLMFLCHSSGTFDSFRDILLQFIMCWAVMACRRLYNNRYTD